ncbi:hypothetical protein [Chitinimonas sp. BJYL2]|nr:hypothetical protein [Chitinimonas sp. BJYL2]
MKPVHFSPDTSLQVGEAVCFVLVSLLLVTAVISDAIPLVGTALNT